MVVVKCVVSKLEAENWKAKQKHFKLLMKMQLSILYLRDVMKMGIDDMILV